MLVNIVFRSVSKHNFKRKQPGLTFLCTETLIDCKWKDNFYNYNCNLITLEWDVET